MLSLKQDFFCEPCQYGKLHHITFSSTPLKITCPLQLVHSNLWGPSLYSSLDCYRYYISFVDDFTRYVWVYPLRLKSEVTSTILCFIKMVERQLDTKLKCLQTDFVGEYRRLPSLLQEHGIAIRHPCPHTHHQQGKVERKHKSIIDMGLTLLAKASMDLKYWWEAFSTITYLLNRLPTPVLNHKSPYEQIFHQPPDYNLLRTFGCACYPYLRPYSRHMFHFRTSLCIFLGYSPYHKGYKCLHSSGRVYIARSVTFDET